MDAEGLLDAEGRSDAEGLAGSALEAPITVLGPISGLSKIHRCEAAERKTEKGNLTTDGHRIVGVPIILQLACTEYVQLSVGSCQEKNK